MFLLDSLVRGLLKKYRQQRHFYALHALHATRSYEKAVCLSVRLSVRLSNAWIVTKRKKVLPRCLYHMKERLSLKNGRWGRGTYLYDAFFTDITVLAVLLAWYL